RRRRGVRGRRRGEAEGPCAPGQGDGEGGRRTPDSVGRVLHYIFPLIIGFDASVVSRGRRHRQPRPVTFVPAACRPDAAKTSVASTDPPRIRHPTAPGRARADVGL